MEPGARFFKCDLHMHTPLDPAGWIGPKLQGGEEGNVKAANDYVRSCYENGLELIAITDHCCPKQS